jgi:hypothetical protein
VRPVWEDATVNDDANDDLAADLAIGRLQRAYADISTRKAWSEFAALVTPDARFSFDTRAGNVIEVVGAAAFVEFGAQATDRFSFYEYVPLNFVVQVDPGDTARGRAYQFEIGQDRDTGEITTYYGMYHDDYARVDGAWRFARRHYQTLARQVGGSALESFPLLDRPF